jgi:hypothetical protein
LNNLQESKEIPINLNQFLLTQEAFWPCSYQSLPLIIGSSFVEVIEDCKQKVSLDVLFVIYGNLREKTQNFPVTLNFIKTHITVNSTHIRVYHSNLLQEEVFLLLSKYLRKESPQAAPQRMEEKLA